RPAPPHPPHPFPTRRSSDLIFHQNGAGPDRHGELLGHRAKALRHHPLSMEMDHNRELAWRVILGDDELESFRRDVDAVAIGVEPQARLRHVGQTMGAAWLEGVLAWPHRFVLPFGHEGAPEISFPEPHLAEQTR